MSRWDTQSKRKICSGDERVVFLLPVIWPNGMLMDSTTLLDQECGFKIFGSRVNLDETERLLLDKGYVCACTGVDDRMSVYTESREKNKKFKNSLLSY